MLRCTLALATKSAYVRTLLLHNPTAGASHPHGDELLRQLKAAGFRPKDQSSKDDYSQTLRKQWDLVIVAGGDGTVARVARRLRDREIPLAILPIGTANNIARALGLNGDIKTLISHLGRSQPKRLDVGVARGPWGKRRFLEAVGFGTIAKTIAHSGPKPPNALRIDMGREELQKYLEEAKAERFEVDVDGEVFAGEFLLVEIMNLGRTGPALPISFTAEHDDGLLDVVFVFRRDARRRYRIARRAHHPVANRERVGPQQVRPAWPPVKAPAAHLTWPQAVLPQVPCRKDRLPQILPARKAVNHR